MFILPVVIYILFGNNYSWVIGNFTVKNCMAQTSTIDMGFSLSLTKCS